MIDLLGNQRGDERLQGQPESSATKPQRGQDQAQVVPRAAHHRMKGIAKLPLERISGQPAVHLHVPDHWLDGAPAFDRRAKLRAEARHDWPRKDNEHRGLERPGAACRSGSA